MNTEKHTFLSYVIYGICSDVVYGYLDGKITDDFTLFDTTDEYNTFKTKVFIDLHKYAEDNDTLFKHMIFPIPILKKIVFYHIEEFLPIKSSKLHAFWKKAVTHAPPFVDETSISEI